MALVVLPAQPPLRCDSQLVCKRRVRQLAIMDQAAARLALFERACQRAIIWSESWANGALLSLGEDLCQHVATSEMAALVPLSATCSSLRSLALPRLKKRREEALRALYLSHSR